MAPKNLEMYAHHLAQTLASLEYLINATPTGGVRDDLTTANLLVMRVNTRRLDEQDPIKSHFLEEYQAASDYFREG